jgi:hypothetical protein
MVAADGSKQNAAAKRRRIGPFVRSLVWPI